MTPATLYLIRHGETEWSLNGRHTGRTDIPLTQVGEAQAEALADALRPVAFDHVRTSPAQRARRTCGLAGLADTAQIDPDLAEWHYGDYEGLLTSEIRRHHPGWSVYRNGCPAGESPADIAIRADRLITRLTQLGGTIALFSHGQFGCSLAARWIGLHVLQAQHLQLGTATISILAFHPRDPEIPVIAGWNAVP